MPRSFNEFLQTLNPDDLFDLGVAVLSDLPLSERIKVILHTFSPSDQQELLVWIQGDEDQEEDKDPDEEEEPEV